MIEKTCKSYGTDLIMDITLYVVCMGFYFVKVARMISSNQAMFRKSGAELNFPPVAGILFKYCSGNLL